MDYPIQLDQAGVMAAIPHREPFLFIQSGRITGIMTAEASATFLEDWPIFKGHFPGTPVVPGVILQEALGQTAALLIKYIPEFEGLIGVFTGVDSCKYRGSVLPGQTLEIKVEITEHKNMKGKVFGKFTGSGRIGDKVVIQFTAKFAAIAPEDMQTV